MLPSPASIDASRALKRAYWFYCAYRVETALRDLHDAVEAKYDRNQPRVPAGNPDGGQWTDGGGGGNTPSSRFPAGFGSGRSTGSQSDEPHPLLHLVGGGRGRGGSSHIRLRTGKRVPATLRQQAELQGLRLRANTLRRQIRNLDPDWDPTPSLFETVDGEIDATRSDVEAAEDYLEELRFREVGPGPYAKESIPARGPERNFRQYEIIQNNENGRKHGCHTCGTKDPGTRSGNFILDHQPPSALRERGQSQRLFPQCKKCSGKQGGHTKALKRESREKQK